VLGPSGTLQGKEAEEYIKQGTMVPASMIIGECHCPLTCDCKNVRLCWDENFKSCIVILVC